jgi:hypothetical protein
MNMKLSAVSRQLLTFVGLLALVGACGGGGSDGDGSSPPVFVPFGDAANAPDVVLLTVSGRTLNFADLSCPPECNVAYLGDPGDAGEAIKTELTNLGFSVDEEHYIAAWNNFKAPDRFGCQQLIADLEWIAANWPDTRIVLAGHSHGCVWAHNVVSVLPDIEIDVLISIDGVSLQWEGDHTPSIDAWIAKQGGSPYSHYIADVTEKWIVGPEALDTKDVVFDHVAFNIEVQSNRDCGVCLVFDEVDNVRGDGSEDGIVRHLSTVDDHSASHRAGTASMTFVLDQLTGLFPEE